MIGRRVIIGVMVALAWAAGLCFMPGYLLFGTLLVMSCICQYEFYTMMAQGGYTFNRNYGIIMGVVWLLACYASPPMMEGYFVRGCQLDILVLFLLIFFLLVRALFDRSIEKPLESTSITLLGFFYLPFMLSFFVRLAQWGSTLPFAIPGVRVGVYLASFVAAVVKFGDIGGYTFGSLFGRHKLCPEISPKKTWEGFWGGLLASMLISVLMVWAVRFFPWAAACPLQSLSLGNAAILGLLLSVTGVLGDLVESRFKRASGLKDSSGLLRESGGILDMFDSLTFTPAVLYFYLTWFVGQQVCV